MKTVFAFSTLPRPSRGNLRRLCAVAVAALALLQLVPDAPAADAGRKPNVVFVFADQWRAQATGFAGDPNVRTPTLDKLATRSVRFGMAVSTCPVCSPYRGSLLTGQYPLTHGVFLNDVCLNNNAVSLAQAFRGAGYRTGYIGKWHVDGHGRSSYIPRERRHGFEFWKVLECTHNYNQSFYYADGDAKLQWEGYDAAAQTREAQRYIREQAGQGPFLLVLSWGPPHDPYLTAPQRFADMYQPDKLKLQPNVPDGTEAVRKKVAGYYAHCSALDDCLGQLWATLRETGIERDTIFVFTSDHGDMLGSHGRFNKQVPYDEAIRVPFLIHWPQLSERERVIAAPFASPDIMPTLLGLCGVEIPKTVEGLDFSKHLRGGPAPGGGAALIACYAPFGQWTRKGGGREYRGVRTERYTYVRSLDGPWLLFDNQADPYQMKNLCDDPQSAALQKELDALLQRKLRETHDDFQPAAKYIEKWHYVTDANGTVRYAP
ncbi:MAG: sulfatase [Verrucomicrobia bacterium]|nr:sulfatase [Verrucomicrobiota bacterium]